jgi:hypothetical protein
MNQIPVDGLFERDLPELSLWRASVPAGRSSAIPSGRRVKDSKLIRLWQRGCVTQSGPVRVSF